MSPIRVVAAVIEKDGLFLACRRAPHKSMAGYWEFPGGKVEPGETDEQALVREIREELGIEIEVGRLLRSDTSGQAGKEIELVSYKCLVVRGSIEQSTDHDEWGWLQVRDLRSLRFAPADLPILSSIHPTR